MTDVNTLSLLPYLLLTVTVFALFWSFIIWLIAYLSGWRQLAEVYPERRPQFSTCWKWQSIGLRWGASYSRALTICAGNGGITLTPVLLFRIGHTPLTIPWEDITVVSHKRTVKLRLQRMPAMSVTITTQLAAKLTEASNGRFSSPTPF